MTSKAGTLLVGLVGSGIVTPVLSQAYRATIGDLKDDWRSCELSQSAEKVASRLAQFGVAVQAITILIIGSLIVKAAIDTDPVQTHGLSEAFRTLNRQPFDRVLQTIAAAG